MYQFGTHSLYKRVSKRIYGLWETLTQTRCRRAVRNILLWNQRVPLLLCWITCVGHLQPNWHLIRYVIARHYQKAFHKKNHNCLQP